MTDGTLYAVCETYQAPDVCPTLGFLIGQVVSVHPNLDSARIAADEVRHAFAERRALSGAVVLGLQADREAHMEYTALPDECPACDWELASGDDQALGKAHDDILLPWEPRSLDATWRPRWAASH
jgi:hypothetical protein